MPEAPNPFDFMGASDEQKSVIDWYRTEYKKLHEMLLSQNPGRYRSLAVTALEESAVWINKAITHGG